MIPADAVHLRTLLNEDLKNADVREMYRVYHNSLTGTASVAGATVSMKINTVPHPTIAARWKDGYALADDMAFTLSTAEAYYLSQNMGRVAKVAAEQLPEDEPLLPTDFPDQNGFLVLDEAFGLIDVRGLPLMHQAVMWSMRGGDLITFWLTDRDDRRDGSNLMLRKDLGDERFMKFVPKLSLSHVEIMKFNQPPPTEARWSETLDPDLAMGLHVAYVEKDNQSAIVWRGPNGEALDLSGGPVHGPSRLGRFLLTVMRLSQQTIAAREPVEVSRGIRRQAERLRVPHGITVIRLRRREGPYATGTGVPLSYQQIVKGHWKRQWYPSLGVHQRIYIDPYLRGPEDTPISQTEKVRAIVR